MSGETVFSSIWGLFYWKIKEGWHFIWFSWAVTSGILYLGVRHESRSYINCTRQNVLPSLGEGALPIGRTSSEGYKAGNRMGRSAVGYSAPWDFSACSGHTEVTVSLCSFLSEEEAGGRFEVTQILRNLLIVVTQVPMWAGTSGLCGAEFDSWQGVINATAAITLDVPGHHCMVVYGQTEGNFSSVLANNLCLQICLQICVCVLTPSSLLCLNVALCPLVFVLWWVVPAFSFLFPDCALCLRQAPLLFPLQYQGEGRKLSRETAASFWR